MAGFDLVSALFKTKKIDKVDAKPDLVEVPIGYKLLYFHCWLCDGITKFAYKIKPKKKQFTIECSRCGVDNVVTVQN